MIGDTMETDILGGVQLGYHTVLVLSGGTDRDDLPRYAYRAGGGRRDRWPSSPRSWKRTIGGRRGCRRGQRQWHGELGAVHGRSTRRKPISAGRLAGPPVECRKSNRTVTDAGSASARIDIRSRTRSGDLIVCQGPAPPALRSGRRGVPRHADVHLARRIVRKTDVGDQVSRPGGRR